MELKLNQSSLPTPIFNSSSNLPKHLTLLAKRWKLHLQQIPWKGHEMSKKILVHVAKEGETLSSISKLYGVPVLEIAAANKEMGIIDVDLVPQGQLVNIPSPVTGNAQLCSFDGSKLNKPRLPKTIPMLGFHNRQWNQIFTVPSSHHLTLAKTSGSLLVVVPLIAFCIRCIMGALENKVATELRHRAVNKSSNSMRWRTLNDLRDPDAKPEHEPEPEPDHDEKPEELHVEDESYSKVEDDYQKFLSECGMSQWGYWRGGSPDK